MKCYFCGKTSIVRGKRKKLRATKYNPTGKRKQKPNLQWVKLENGKRVLACTHCIKTLSKTGKIIV